MNGTVGASVLALAAGLAGAAQIAVQGRLGERVGSLEAVLIATVVTALAVAPVLLLVRRGAGSSEHGVVDGVPSAGIATDYVPPGAAQGFQYVGNVTPLFGFAQHRHFIAAQGGQQPFAILPPSLALLYCRKD